MLYFEGDRADSFRILRAVKNRYGSTNEIGVFSMGERGMTQIEDPSALFCRTGKRPLPAARPCASSRAAGRSWWSFRPWSQKRCSACRKDGGRAGLQSPGPLDRRAGKKAGPGLWRSGRFCEHRGRAEGGRARRGPCHGLRPFSSLRNLPRCRPAAPCWGRSG